MTDQEFKKYMERSPEECMRVVFDEYCNYVYVIAATKLKNCGTTEDIEECVSDVFTEVFKRINYIGERDGDLFAEFAGAEEQCAGGMFAVRCA